jgi:hypothetical protein
MIIYKTTNLLNEKIYVGQDSKNNPEYYGSGKYFLNAVKKHGKENFKKQITCECSSKEELNKKEKFWIKELNSKYPNGYNLSSGGEGGDTFTNSSEENKKRIKIIQSKPRSEESKNNMKISHHRSDVQKKERKPRSEEAKMNMRKPKSEEHRKNMTLSQNRLEVKEKISKALFGHLVSEETKIKMRKPKSEEARKKD